MTFEEMLAKLHDRYAAAATRSGREYQCLAGESRDGVMGLSTEDGMAVVRIQGPLDDWWGVSAAMVARAMDEAAASAYKIIIDSPGGLMSEGLTLYTDLRARMDNGTKITTEGRGLVASAAVLPLLAGDDRYLRDGTLVMIHNPWSYIGMAGDVAELKKVSGQAINGLQAHTDNYKSLIAKRTSTPEAAVLSAMEEETWYSAKEAVEAGYASKVLDVEPESDPEPEPSDMARAAASRVIMNTAARIAARMRG